MIRKTMPLFTNRSREWCQDLYRKVIAAEDTDGLRRLCREDLFFLLTMAMKRKDVDDPWLYERCREVEADPNGYLDLWAREHYKSTIITFALTIQDILKDPELTVGIFSHTKPQAKKFLGQIKKEFEDNTFLKELFPEILYDKPNKVQGISWSLDTGITVKRVTNPAAKTVEAHGLVDGQPTGSHFKLLVYDDVVTLESVSTPEMIKKVNNAFGLSLNLGMSKGGIRRAIGTRYHFNDTYRLIMKRKTFEPRTHKATDDGKVTGTPVFLTRAKLAEKRKDMGPYVFACQMMQNPAEDSVMGFKEEWLSFYDQMKNNSEWNYYILCDPAGEKKKQHSQEPDYTVFEVWGTAPDGNYYLMEAVRDRMNLRERTSMLFYLHRKWKPLKTGYEKYGMQSDIEHIEEKMEEKNYRFNIIPLAGPQAKNDRIRRLVPDFEQHKIWLPRKMMYVNLEGKAQDFIKIFLEEEYTAFPVAVHDDIFDCACRLKDADMGIEFPEFVETPYPSMTMGQTMDRCLPDPPMFG
jgi:predicted phage terminase large subunit-like protein